MVKISSNIKYLRTERGMSQTALAEAVGLNRGNIASYEKELAQPSLENLIKLAEYFAISLDDLCRYALPRDEEQKNGLTDILSEGLNLRGLKNRVQMLKGDSDMHKKVAALKKQNQELLKVVAGFEAYHQHKMMEINQPSIELTQLSDDYKRLLDLLNTVLKSNKDLIRLLED